MKHLMTGIFALTLGSCGINPTDATLKDEVPATHSDTGVLGQAYSTLHKKIQPYACVVGTELDGGNEVGTLKYVKNMNVSQVSQVLQGNLGVRADFPLINAGPLADMAINQASDSLSETHTLYWKGVYGKKLLALGTIEPSPQAKALLDAGDFKTLHKTCGDEFISEIQYGALLMATLRIDYLNSNDKNNFKGGLDLNIEGTQVGIKSKLESLSETVKKRIHVSIHANQWGGDSAGLMSILPENVVECTAANLTPCLDTIRALIRYGQEDFRQSLETETEWNITKYVTQPYDAAGVVSLAPEIPLKASVEVRRLRDELEELYIEELTNQERSKRMLSFIDPIRQREQHKKISAIARLAADNLVLYRSAMEVCYDTPEECVSYWEAYKGKVKSFQVADLDVSLPPDLKVTIHAGSRQTGADFSDLNYLKGLKTLSKIKRIGITKSSIILRKLSYSYENGASKSVGGSRFGTEDQDVILADDEYITSVSVASDEYFWQSRIVAMNVDTNKRKGIIRFGNQKSYTKVNFVAPAGMQIIGFHGKAGNVVDRLGVIYGNVPIRW